MDAAVWAAVRLEMIREGWPLVPVTPEEVAAVEAVLDESAVELPPGLADPGEILKRVTP